MRSAQGLSGYDVMCILSSGGIFYPKLDAYETKSDVNSRFKREGDLIDLVNALNSNPNFHLNAVVA